MNFDRPNYFDGLVYRLFRYIWNPIFIAKPKLAEKFIECMVLEFEKRAERK